LKRRPSAGNEEEEMEEEEYDTLVMTWVYVCFFICTEHSKGRTREDEVGRERAGGRAKEKER
jgi:hypothetical protein